VIDGLSQKHPELQEAGLEYLRGHPACKLILVASAQTVIQDVVKDMLGIRETSLSSWILDDYQAALGYAVFCKYLARVLTGDADQLNAIAQVNRVAISPYKKIIQLATSPVPRYKKQGIVQSTSLNGLSEILDYYAALGGDAMLERAEIRKQKLIKKWLEPKYFLGGSSARWVFSLSPKKVQAEIDIHLERVENLDLLTKGLSGSKSNLAVNHLIMRRKHNVVLYSFVVSRAAARAIAEKCDFAWIEAASHLQLAADNPSFDGWILEADFLLRLRCAAQQIGHTPGTPMPLSNIFDGNNIAVDWFVESRHFFWDVSELTQAPKLGPHDWLLPSRWNQGGYDVVQLLPNAVRFIQITRAASHSVKLKYLVEVLDLLTQRKFPFAAVHIAFVVPLNHGFTMPAYKNGKLGSYEAILKRQSDGAYEVFYYLRSGVQKEGPPLKRAKHSPTKLKFGCSCVNSNVCKCVYDCKCKKCTCHGAGRCTKM